VAHFCTKEHFKLSASFAKAVPLDQEEDRNFS